VRLPPLPCEEKKVGNAKPAKHLIDRGGLADQCAQPERGNDSVNRPAASRPAARPRFEGKGCQIRHIRPGGEFEKQDCRIYGEVYID
jgi:hypothetical protein